ncbi:DUF3080 family protein [Alteromonas flava]|uniref:DUF3080 family protein n=1 Tax=Alteromonas flava TaxID=2048003 RepID=UPI000C28B56E|nr:DUF3080 family protein [Alteromonas flava]
MMFNHIQTTMTLKRARAIFFLLVCLALSCLTGCSPNRVSTTLDEYVERLARVMDDKAPNVNFTPTQTFPSKAELRQEVQSLSLNVREFLNLPNCRLSTLVAERNTALGKTQPPSQRFVYEVTVTQALQECADTATDESVQKQLRELAFAKQSQLSANYANLLQTSDELILAFSQAQGVFAGDSSDGLHATIAALQYLTAVNPQQSRLAVQSEQLEEHLQSLLQHRLPAKLWRTQSHLAESLQTINAWLAPLFKELNCKSTDGAQRAEILRNVFMLFFAEQIQPLAAQVNTYHYQLSPVLTELLKAPNLSPKLLDSVQQRIDAHDIYSAAVREHIELWQDLFSRCAITVTAQ